MELLTQEKIFFSKPVKTLTARKTETEILELFKYFSIFQHPLKAEEVYKFSSLATSVEFVRFILNEMQVDGFLKQTGNYYLLATDSEKIIEKRIAGEKRAAKILPKAKKAAWFISLFPFVKFVGISGSLSKNVADEKSDCDFFIITAANTLWICRTILHLIKKLSFIIQCQHALCMNYFIDEDHLQLAEKNIFVKIELSTLIPVYSKNGIYQTLLLENKELLNNIQHLGIDFEKPAGSNVIKQNKRNGFWKPLNIFLMKLTDIKWRSKWQKRGYPMQDYDEAFKTTPHISKNHPANYQKKILEQLCMK